MNLICQTMRFKAKREKSISPMKHFIKQYVNQSNEIKWFNHK